MESDASPCRNDKDRLPGLLVPARLVSHAPCRPLSLRRRPQPVCARRLSTFAACRPCLPPDPRPSTSATPRDHLHNPIIIYRYLWLCIQFHICPDGCGTCTGSSRISASGTSDISLGPCRAASHAGPDSAGPTA